MSIGESSDQNCQNKMDHQTERECEIKRQKQVGSNGVISTHHLQDSTIKTNPPDYLNEQEDTQKAIQNIDQELLFNVAQILSSSNNATQLISDWSHSPSKLKTSNLEDQLRHFAQCHQNVLADNCATSASHNSWDQSQ